MKKITYFHKHTFKTCFASKTKLLLVLIISTCITVVGQNVNIPDANFKAFLLSNSSINTNGDSEIQVSEASGFNGGFNAVGLGITDLTGIEAFTNLSDFSAANNMLTSVDLSQNINLVEIRLSNNQLTSIDVSSLTNLIYLQLFNNPLTSLDVSNNLYLETLILNNALLTSIDVTNNPFLRQLEVSINQLISVNITGLVLLEELYLFNNQITSIDLSTNPQLNFVRLDSNNLTSFNMANGNNGNINTFFADLNPNLSCINIDQGFTPGSGWFKDVTAIYSDNCSSLSVTDFDITNFKVYPNPVQNQLHIQTESKPKNYTVFSVLGKEIITGKFNASLNVSQLKAGIYFIKINSENGSVTKRFIKQ